MSQQASPDIAWQSLPAVPLELHTMTVQPEWIDYNGHMNVAYYVLAFDKATDRFFDMLGIGADYTTAANMSAFVLETHVTYAQEVKCGDPLRFTLQLLDFDPKRLHFFLQMYHGEDDYLSATSELLIIHVDLGARRSSPFPTAVHTRVERVMAAHRELPWPAQAGGRIGIRRPD